MPCIEFRNLRTSESVDSMTGRAPKGKFWRKAAVVFREANGKWAAASLPFPAMECYGCNDDGDGICSSYEEAARAALDAGCLIVSEKEMNEHYV